MPEAGRVQPSPLADGRSRFAQNERVEAITLSTQYHPRGSKTDDAHYLVWQPRADRKPVRLPVRQTGRRQTGFTYGFLQR